MEKNKGFTLIELLVTIAILSIVLTGVTTIMVTGSKSFTKGNADANMQSQAQLIVNQIEDMVIDTNGGVDYIDNGGSREFVLYNAFDAADGSGTNYTKEMVKWVGADNKLLYSKWNVNYNVTSGTYEVITPAEVTDALLAEDVSDFSIDLSDTRKEYDKSGAEIDVVQSVQITVGCIGNGGQVSYATSPVITLRNRLMLSADPEMIFDNTPTSSDTLKLYISGASEGAAARTPIQDRVTEVDRDQSYNIYAMINAENDVNSLVNWTIEESGSTSTINESGLLHVGESESNPYLTIVATYKNNPGKYAKGVVKVAGGDLKSLDAVHITTKSLQAFRPSFGSQVETTGFSDQEIQELQYTWTLSKDCADFTNNLQTLDLVVRDGFYGEMITITLSVYSPATNQTKQDQIIYHIDQKGTWGESYIERGNEGTGYDLWYSVEGITGAPGMSLEYYFCDEYGNKTSDSDSLIQYVTITYQYETLHFKVSPDLPAGRGYFVKAIVHYTGEAGQAFDYEKIFQVAQAQILGKTTIEATTTPSTYHELRYVISGYNQQAWFQNRPVTYEVMEFIYDAPDGVTVTPTFGNLTTAGYDNTMVQTISMSVQNGSASQVVLKSIKVKITFTNAPSIFAYSDIIFGQSE